MQVQLNIQSYYVNGYNTLVITKLRVWDAHKEQRILVDSSSSEPSIKHYFSQADFPIDSISEYSHGYWCRYLTTIPTRIITRPSSTPISRFSGTTRILGINIIQGSYQFQTYDTTTSNPSLQTSIKYSELEGIWTYLYIGYKRSERTVICYVMKSG